MPETASRPSRARIFLDILSTVALVAASVAVIWAVWFTPAPQPTLTATGRPSPPLPIEPIPIEGAAVKGSLSAPVGIIVFSEFQCPFCGRFARETLPTLTQNFVDSGKVLFAFRHLPLETIHPQALVAGEIASCSQNQGMFWQAHDAFFQEPLGRSADDWRKRALTVGVQIDELEKCMADGTAAASLRHDIELARRLELRSTPVFIIGPLLDGSVKATRIIMGAQPTSIFEEAIADVLEQAR
ncbi:MAG: thioredoxin domain-containing protein [Vicinamibacterales bacterium]